MQRSFSGNGANQDIVVASARAYVSALNKLIAFVSASQRAADAADAAEEPSSASAVRGPPARLSWPSGGLHVAELVPSLVAAFEHANERRRNVHTYAGPCFRRDNMLSTACLQLLGNTESHPCLMLPDAPSLMHLLLIPMHRCIYHQQPIAA